MRIDESLFLKNGCIWGKGYRKNLFWSVVGEDDQGFPGGSDGKESARNAGDPGPIPGSGRSPREVHGLPTPVLLPGESHGWRKLASPWGHKQSNMTE